MFQYNSEDGILFCDRESLKNMNITDTRFDTLNQPFVPLETRIWKNAEIGF